MEVVNEARCVALILQSHGHSHSDADTQQQWTVAVVWFCQRIVREWDWTACRSWQISLLAQKSAANFSLHMSGWWCCVQFAPQICSGDPCSAHWGLGAARSGGRVLTSPAHHLLSGVLSALGLWVCYCSFLFWCWGAPWGAALAGPKDALSCQSPLPMHPFFLSLGLAPSFCASPTFFFSWSLLSTRYLSWRERRLAGFFFFGGMPAGSAALVFLLSRYWSLTSGSLSQNLTVMLVYQRVVYWIQGRYAMTHR